MTRDKLIEQALTGAVVNTDDGLALSLDAEEGLWVGRAQEEQVSVGLENTRLLADTLVRAGYASPTEDLDKALQAAADLAGFIDHSPPWERAREVLCSLAKKHGVAIDYPCT